ncbi:MAG: ABC transporter ATP-binding protein [Nitrososphaerales archaeon]
MIELDGVTKKYGKVKVINDLSFKVEKGGVVALLGPNGAGKTTLLKCILGLVRFRGSISVDGLDVKRKGKEVRRRVAYVPQQFSLYNNLSVIDNMRFYADIKGVSGETFKRRLEKGELENFAKKRAGDLSEGLRQRLMLATALLADSPILLFDEPTSNLDIKSVLEFKELIKSQVKEDKTILLSTHLLSDVNEIASKVVVINKGRLLFKGYVDDLLGKMELSTRILVTLSEELKPESVGSVKDLLIKAGAKEVSTEDEFITVSSNTANKISVLKAVEEAGLTIKDFRIFESSLEEAFLKITSDGENRW